MSYGLGVDLGTTWTGAAVAVGSRVAACTLESHQTLVPSLVHLAADGSWSFGVAAKRRAESEPDGLARAFKRSFGDPVPPILSGQSVSVPELTGRLLRWVVDRVVESEGSQPETVVVTHPAHWSETQRRLLRSAASDALSGIEVGLVTEPEAIAVHFASERTPPDGTIAVYDFGGGTFDATILATTATGFRVVGEPIGRADAGGIDLDDLVVGWALGQLDAEALRRIDRSDPVVMRAMRRLRDDAVVAKETLSTESEAVLAVGLPTVRDELRLVRSEFEELVRPVISSTVDALVEASATAAIAPTDLRLVLLAGGSSRVPLVSELLAERLGAEVSSAVHPKLSVALGAAATLQPTPVRPMPPSENRPAPTPPAEHLVPRGNGSEVVGFTADRRSPGPSHVPTTVAGSGAGIRGWAFAALGIVAIVAAAWFAFGRDGDTGTADGASTTTVASNETAPPATAAPDATATLPDVDPVTRAQEVYFDGANELRDFVTQAPPRSAATDEGFSHLECRRQLISLYDNVDFGVDLVELADDVAAFPVEFRDRMGAFPDQVRAGYTLCDEQDSLLPVATRVLGGLGAHRSFVCATGIVDQITLVDGSEHPCPGDGDELGVCTIEAGALIEEFLSAFESRPAPEQVCAAAIANDEAAFALLEAAP